MTWMRTVCALAIAAAPLAAERTPQTATPVRGSIGVMRADGVLLPLATLQNKTWRPLAVDRGNGLRMTAEARGLSPDGWRLMSPPGNPRPFRLTKPLTVPFECSKTDVFETTMATGKRLSGGDKTRVIGVGVQGDVPIERAADLASANDSRSRRIRDLISGAGQALETERFDAFRSEDRYLNFVSLRRFSAVDRAKRPWRFDRVFHHKHGNTDWYYFEAQKDYSEVERVFYVGGWIGAFGSESHMIDVQAGIAGGISLDNPEYTPADVLGVLPGRTPGEGATWIMARRSNLEVAYELFRVGDDSEYQVRRILRVFASHCIP